MLTGILHGFAHKSSLTEGLTADERRWTQIRIKSAGNSHLAAGGHFWYGGVGGMGRKRIIWLTVALFVALLVVAVCIVWEPGGPPEPMYQGKPLTYWLRSGQPFTVGPIRDALDAIGTNAIPTLLRELRAKEDSPLKRELCFALQKVPFVHYSYYRGVERNYYGSEGFNFLGAKAKDAVPQLIELFQQQISDDSQMSTAFSLGYIGPDAAAAIPMLIVALTNSPPGVRNACAHALGEIHSLPELTIPALTNSLHDADIYVRSRAASAFVRFGDAAKPVVPALVAALSDPNESVNAAAEQALRVIDLGALEQARKEGKVRPR